MSPLVPNNWSGFGLNKHLVDLAGRKAHTRIVSCLAIARNADIEAAYFPGTNKQKHLVPAAPGTRK